MYLLPAVKGITSPQSQLTYNIKILNQFYFALLLVPLIFFSTSFYSNAQHYNNLTPYIKTNDIIQDKNGFIWFAGQKGLSRYDDANVITFSSQSEEWKVPFTWIHNITLVDDDIIVSTEADKLWKFNPKTGQASKLSISLPLGDIYGFLEFKGNYFLNISNDIYEYSVEKETISQRANNIKISLLEKTQGNLYIAGKSGLYKLHNNSFSAILNDEVTSITSVPTGIIALTNKTIYYFGDDGNQNKIPNNGQFTVSTKSNDLQTLLVNKKGQVEKLSIPKLSYLAHKYPDFEPLIPKKLIQDSSQTLWTTSNLGIKKISPSSIKNHPLVFDIAINDNEMVLFDNKVVLGAYGDGIHSFNELAPELSKNINPYLTPLAKKTMDLLVIERKLYIATFDGVWVYDADNKIVKKLNIPENNKIILKLTLDKNILYIATNDDGVFIFDLSSQKIIDHIGAAHGISQSEVIDVIPSGTQKIWLATSKGIDIYNLYTKKIQHIDIPGKSKVISLAASNNKIFASTKGDGIFVLNYHGEILSRLGVGTDFSSISAINDEIWAPSDHGLYRINTKKNTMYLVPNTENYIFSDSPVLHNNKVYLTHFGGVLEVDLEKFDPFNPIITISEINISGKLSIENKSITVAEENDVITLTLASLDYRSGKNKRFQYKINDGEWNKTNNNQLTFTALKSGDYAITIRGTNSLGQWSNKEAFAEIKVKYPWYATQEMKIAYFVIFVFLLLKTSWLLYLRSKSISHVHQLLSNDVNTKGKSAFNVTRNLMQAKELLDNSRSIENNRNTILNIVEKCIKELNANEENNEPDALFGKSLDIALPYFSDYIHKKYQVNLTLEYNLNDVSLTYELQSDIYRIIYEAITSAIINSNNHNFEVSIQEFKQKLWLTISNNENSFSNYNNKVNFDMSIYFIRQIAAKHSASINVFDKETTGSQIVISIPLMTLS